MRPIRPACRDVGFTQHLGCSTAFNQLALYSTAILSARSEASNVVGLKRQDVRPLSQFVKKLTIWPRIECAGGFVSDRQRRVSGQGGRKGYALLCPPENSCG